VMFLLPLQLPVFVFILNAFNDETVSRKHVSCAPLKMCLSYFNNNNYNNNMATLSICMQAQCVQLQATHR